MSKVILQQKPSFNKASLKTYTRISVLMDENTRQFCYDKLQNQLPPHSVMLIESGEEHKNLVTCEKIWQQLTDQQLDRHSLLMVVGGGVLGDMGGFCAATFKRGIDFMLIPTTLLSQVDASVGGKLGIDFGAFKNHIGVFQEPVTTHIATDFLKTLPTRELRSGFAEVIKHCVIADRKMWETIRKKKLEDQDWLKLVKHSTNIKSVIVKKDPKEKGLRKILNFGHTIGHAIEGYFLTHGDRLFHGEAVAAGMIMESRVAAKKKLIKEDELESISRYIISIFGKIALPETADWLLLMKQDKKNMGGKIMMALPKRIGKAVWDVPVSENEIRDAVRHYRSLV